MKEAKMVRASRRVKRAKVGRRTGRGVVVEPVVEPVVAEKSLVNWLSL